MQGCNIEWLEGLNVRGIRPGLDNIRSLVDALGDPQESLRVIHVAGSDGKGSVCCMIESILIDSGIRTGMFTTPQILEVNECIRIDGRPISDDLLDRGLSEVRRASEDIGCECTNFEALTACALLSFKEAGCEIVIVEVGMGGRLDSTNIVTPEIAIINNISMEHTRFLGSTIREIAGEKAGIMKPGTPCITINTGESLDVIRDRSEELGCPLIAVPPDSVSVLENSEDHIVMEYKGRVFRVGLPGRFQGRNAALAIEGVSALKDHERIAPHIQSGLEKAHWPARMELIPETSLILDVTHTKVGAKCLSSDIQEIYGKVTLVTAMLSDKDLAGVAETLSPIASEVLVSAPASPRAADPEELASCYRRFHDNVHVYPSVADAMDEAVKRPGKILVTGSFRTAEDCLKWLRRTR